MSIDVYPPRGLLVPGTVQVTEGLAYSFVNLSTGMVSNSVLFVDATSLQAQAMWRVPGGYAGGAITASWYVRAAGTGGAVRLQYTTAILRDGVAQNVLEAATIQDLTPVDMNTHLITRTVAAGLLQEGDQLRLQMARLGGDAADTLASPLAMDGISVTYLATVPRVFNAQPYEEGSFTVTATGFSGTAPSGTARYVRVGKQVTLYFPQLSGTSNATALTVTGLPAGLFPLQLQQTFIARMQNNAGEILGLIILGSDGTILLFPSPGLSWTASGAKALYPTTITYILS